MKPKALGALISAFLFIGCHSVRQSETPKEVPAKGAPPGSQSSASTTEQDEANQLANIYATANAGYAAVQEGPHEGAQRMAIKFEFIRELKQFVADHAN